jgi:tRNA pseudouridine32 synthase/23S rRNA pseudouridine746 synthase/23S rRNA pseudouridine1911/1915/1917 synthase
MEYKVSTPIKVLDALRALYPDSSRRTLQNWLKAGRFTLDGKPLYKEHLELAEGQVVRSQVTFRAQEIPGLKILYEDRYLVAIDKPEGLLSVPLDEGLSRKRHALGMLRDHYQTDQIYAVHRIDRDTSGCLLFARGKQAEERLKELFELHDLTREYFAIVEGRMKEPQGTWQSHLLELENLKVVESPEGKEAITHYSIVRRSPKFTFLKLRLETGRKHQIRVHCSSAGHPILGDERYGAIENPLDRLCLHAMHLELIHPFTRKKLVIDSPLPPAFKKLGAHLAS